MGYLVLSLPKSEPEVTISVTPEKEKVGEYRTKDFASLENKVLC